MDSVQALRIEQVMTPAPVSLEAACTLGGALCFLMREHHQAAPLLDDHGELVGLVTRAHLLAWLARLLDEGGGPELTLGEIMARGVEPAVDRDPLRCSAGMRLKDACKLLLCERAPALLVVRDGRVVGILTLSDVARAVAHADEPALGDHQVHALGHGHCFSPTGLPEHLPDHDDAEEEQYLLEVLLARRR